MQLEGKEKLEIFMWVRSIYVSQINTCSCFTYNIRSMCIRRCEGIRERMCLCTCMLSSTYK